MTSTRILRDPSTKGARRLALGSFAGVFLAACLVGCSDAAHESPKPRNSQEFLAAILDVACPPLADCCASDPGTFDAGLCQSEAEKDLGLPETSVAVDFDRDAAAACIADYATKWPSCRTSEAGPAGDFFAFGFSEFASCARVFRPTRAPGESCTVSSDRSRECIAPDGRRAVCLTERPGGALACGFVDPARVATAGADCMATCATADDTACATQFSAGGVCLVDHGLYCSPATGRCELQGEVGQACAISAADRTFACRAPATCVTARQCHPSSVVPFCAGTCEVFPRPQLGEPCRLDTLEIAICADGLYCPSDELRCRARKAAGEPCTREPSFPPECTDGNLCNASTGRCAPPGGVGAPCAFDTECRSELRCSVGEPTEAVGEGLPPLDPTSGECVPRPLSAPFCDPSAGV